MVAHLGVRKYKCSNCKRDFGRESALVNHKNIAHPEKKPLSSTQLKSKPKDTNQDASAKKATPKPKSPVSLKSKTNAKLSGTRASKASVEKSKKRLQLKRSAPKKYVKSSPKRKLDVKKATSPHKTPAKVFKAIEPDESAFNAAEQFGFTTLNEMFSRRTKLDIERIEVPEKLWTVIEKIERSFAEQKRPREIKKPAKYIEDEEHSTPKRAKLQPQPASKLRLKIPTTTRATSHDRVTPVSASKRSKAVESKKKPEDSPEKLDQGAVTVEVVETENTEQSVGSFSTEGKGYWCNVCSRGFSRLAALEKHKKASHANEREKLLSFKSGKSSKKKPVVKPSIFTHKCSYCKRRFIKEESLAVHMKVHGKQTTSSPNLKSPREKREQSEKRLGSYECETCSKKFNSKLRFDAHVRSHDNDRLKCVVCKIPYSSFEELMQHSCDDNMFSCPECSRKFLQKSVLTKHINQSHREKVFKCRSCPKKFASLSVLKKHEISHKSSKGSKGGSFFSSSRLTGFAEEKTKPFCEMCNQAFSKRSLKNQHMVKVHGPEWTHECKICWKVFPDRGMLLRHQIVHKNLETESKNATSSSLDADILESQAGMDSMIVSESGQDSTAVDMTETFGGRRNKMIIEDEVLDSNQTSDSNKCNLCSKVFATSYHLYVHKTTVHETPAKIKSIRCTWCKEKFSDCHLLNQHIHKIHSEASRCEYRCELCVKSFRKYIDYRKHLRTHPETMLFQCKFCPKRFFSESTMTSHVEASHKDEKSEFQCKFCDQLFDDFKEFSKHRKTHPEDDPYLCIHCNVSFTNKHALKSHLPKHGILVNDGYKMSCDYCFKVFSNPKKVQEHQKNSCPQRPTSKDSKTATAEQVDRMRKSVSVPRCDICHKRFSSRSFLKIHKQMHFKDKRFACEFCGLGFADNSDLARHRLDHNYDSEFVCFVCGKMFLETEDLMRHETAHRLDNTMFCSVKIVGQTNLLNKPGTIELIDLNPIVEDLVARKWRELP